MKTLTFAFLAASMQPITAQEVLSPSDREVLLERLEKIREEADSKVDARFRSAISAFQSAMGSPNSSCDLYLKCEEMVNFDAMKKKNVDFREWKRKNADKHLDAGFRLALQLQLRWLVLTLQAASEKPDRDRLAIEAGKLVETIAAQAEKLSAHRDVIQQEVTASVFARAYQINNVQAENWPLAPAQFPEVYEKVLLPPLRRMDRIESLRATWTKRIIHQSTLIDAWSGKPGEKQKSGVHSPAYDKFVSETVPNLQWEAEVDLFNLGDERGAAVRMLAHIEKYLSHAAAPKWAESFMEMLQAAESAKDGP
jgi:hypothetical protein